jgi:hypothetical protein
MRKLILLGVLFVASEAFAAVDCPPAGSGRTWATGQDLYAADLNDCVTDIVAKDYLVGTATTDLSGEIVAGTTPGGELEGTWAAPTLDDSVAVASWSLTTPIFLGITDFDGGAVSDDDCTGQIGQMWFDDTDNAFEFCNADSGAPGTVAATSGDVTSVGDCTTGACFTGATGTLLQSNTDLIMELDQDNNGSESFQIKDGADALVVECTEAGACDMAAGVTASSFTADSAASPELGFDDSVAAGTESKIVGNATADNNGGISLQVEEAAATYFEGLKVSSTAGAVTVEIGGVAGGNDITVSETGVVTFAGSAIPLASIPFNAAGLTADGTQCADAAKVTINSGPVQYTILCADNDASSIYGVVSAMPDGWDAGTITVELITLQSAADTSAMNSDISAQCRGTGETPSSTWGTEVAIDDAAVGGSNIVDHNTSAAVTPAGTCAAGDSLWLRWQLDATGTTTAVATYHVLGWKVEYGRSALSD